MFAQRKDVGLIVSG